MKSVTLSALLTSCLLGIPMMVTACQSASPATSPATGVEAKASALDLNLRAGQVLQLALVEPKAGDAAQAARQTYYRTALPLAEEFGDERLGQLGIAQTLVGEAKPASLIFYAFPDEASRDGFEAHPNWAEYKATRPEGWSNLMVYSTTIPQDMSLQFDPHKHYTLAVAWTTDDNPQDYDRYLEGVEAEFDTIGARFMHKFRNISYEDHNAPGATAPAQMTFVEWDSADGVQKLFQTDGYKNNQAFFQSGVKDIHFYRLSSPAS